MAGTLFYFTQGFVSQRILIWTFSFVHVGSKNPPFIVFKTMFLL